MKFLIVLVFSWRYVIKGLVFILRVCVKGSNCVGIVVGYIDFFF